MPVEIATRYPVRPEAREQDYPHPVEAAPSPRVGNLVYLGYYLPAGLMPLEDSRRYLRDALRGEPFYQCVSDEGALVVVRNNAGVEFRVDPNRAIWIPVPRFQLGDSVRTKVGTLRDGWISNRVWHRKHQRLYYLIDIILTRGKRKRYTRWYWEDELELIASGETT